MPKLPAAPSAAKAVYHTDAQLGDVFPHMMRRKPLGGPDAGAR